MASESPSRRSIAGIILAVAGGVLLIDAILGFAGVTALGVWPTVLAWAAIGVAFLVLALGSFRSTLTRVALIVGAAGWLFLALAAAVALPGLVTILAALAATLGTLVAAIALYTGKEVSNRSAIAFIVTAVLAAAILLPALGGLALGQLLAVFALLFAIGLIVTGVLFARVQGARGR